MGDKPLDLAAIRARLAAARGQEYWRCLEELADTPEFRELVRRDAPRLASVWDAAMSRRSFLKLLGASLALAGLASCGVVPADKIVPYVSQPEDLIPGKPLFYASAMTLRGYAAGILVESNMGRPTKIEGNPDHPASLGATDAFAQASVLTLYDPDRSQVIFNQGRIRTWDEFMQDFRAAIQAQNAKKGAGLRLLTETVTSPTLAGQLRSVLSAYPSARWYQYEPAGRDNARSGARLAFGQPVETVYHLDQADVVLTLDADLLNDLPGSLRYAHDFMARRRLGPGQNTMNRLYAVESTLTLTGTKADHRLPLRAADVQAFARALAAELGAGPGAATPANVPPKWMPALVRDLQSHRGSSLIVAGDGQPPYVHALAHAMNDALGSVGRTITYHDPVESNPVSQMDSLRDLVADLQAGRVDLLVILGGNPVSYAPADLAFGAHLPQAGLSVRLGLYEDETSALCHWHIPQTHYLEEWSDARAFDGTTTIIQPLIAPLYGGKSAHELLAAFGDQPDTSGHDLVQAFWKTQRRAARDFSKFWPTTLHDGLAANSALPARNVTLQTGWQAAPPPPPGAGVEIVFRTDPSAFDGRFANNGWLQELPRPLSKITWDNAALVSPATAQRLGLANEDLVELRYQGRTVRAPVWVMPGQADDSVTVTLGYGRTRAGHVADGVGFDAYALRTSTAPWFDTGLEIAKLGQSHTLATTQRHYVMEGRDLVRAATLDEFSRNPAFAQKPGEQPGGSLYPGYKYEGDAWGMAIDLVACVGCNACVAACQAENNIPIVGKDQVIREREMHWLRIDTYFTGDPVNPDTYFQPVPCMQCENAPCELVCPVGATVHSADGLNQMVYNRCVGTRYCSNNCPYKVRHFNFYRYADYDTPSLKLLNNPNVTVRERGVMEKCTYCVQRINRARIQAGKEGRSIRDGEILTACQAVCPTNAIVFGNINDRGSQVAKLKSQSRNYALLAELNTRPRTTYLAAVRNPNPELA